MGEGGCLSYTRYILLRCGAHDGSVPKTEGEKERTRNVRIQLIEIRVSYPMFQFKSSTRERGVVSDDADKTKGGGGPAYPTAVHRGARRTINSRKTELRRRDAWSYGRAASKWLFFPVQGRCLSLPLLLPTRARGSHKHCSLCESYDPRVSFSTCVVLRGHASPLSSFGEALFCLGYIC